MNGLVPGFWDIADRGLQWVGSNAAWLVLRRRFTEEESAKYAATGGALVFALFGGTVGFILSDPTEANASINGTVFGASLGVCLGIFFGSFVETVDGTIKDLLRSLTPKKD
jgi:uncharacterized YccA/Bax inhibitor family protein